MVLAVASVAFLASLLSTALARALAKRRGMWDIPNNRSLHSKPVLRGGGLGMVATILAFTVWQGLSGNLPPGLMWALVIGGGAVALVGWFDDRRPLSNRIRLSVWIPAAAWAAYMLGGLPTLDLGGTELVLGLAGWAVAVVGIVWMLILYNFMDGADGFAGSQAAVAGGAAALLLFLGGSLAFAGIAAVVAGAAMGFLVWNRPPARVFMGDVGSTFLGYTFATLAIATENTGALPLWVWALLLGVFLVDATFTMIRRMIKGERFWEPHRTHAYQRAVAQGASHAQITFSLIVLDLGLAVLAYWAWTDARSTPFIILGVLVALALLWRLIVTGRHGRPQSASTSDQV